MTSLRILAFFFHLLWLSLFWVGPTAHNKTTTTKKHQDDVSTPRRLFSGGRNSALLREKMARSDSPEDKFSNDTTTIAVGPVKKKCRINEVQAVDVAKNIMVYFSGHLWLHLWLYIKKIKSTLSFLGKTLVDSSTTISTDSWCLFRF